jgi:hypothetical protein
MTFFRILNPNPPQISTTAPIWDENPSTSGLVQSVVLITLAARLSGGVVAPNRGK